MQPPPGAGPGVQGLASTPDLESLLTTIFQVQANAQLAQANATNANFIAFHTTTQALAAKGGDKDSN